MRRGLALLVLSAAVAAGSAGFAATQVCTPKKPFTPRVRAP